MSLCVAVEDKKRGGLSLFKLLDLLLFGKPRLFVNVFLTAAIHPYGRSTSFTTVAISTFLNYNLSLHLLPISEISMSILKAVIRLSAFFPTLFLDPVQQKQIPRMRLRKSPIYTKGA